jgi:hypothetical protein
MRVLVLVLRNVSELARMYPKSRWNREPGIRSETVDVGPRGGRRERASSQMVHM